MKTGDRPLCIHDVQSELSQLGLTDPAGLPFRMNELLRCHPCSLHFTPLSDIPWFIEGGVGWSLHSKKNCHNDITTQFNTKYLYGTLAPCPATSSFPLLFPLFFYHLMRSVLTTLLYSFLAEKRGPHFICVQNELVGSVSRWLGWWWKEVHPSSYWVGKIGCDYWYSFQFTSYYIYQEYHMYWKYNSIICGFKVRNKNKLI